MEVSKWKKINPVYLWKVWNILEGQTSTTMGLGLHGAHP
jgi:hypothetical protein